MKKRLGQFARYGLFLLALTVLALLPPLKVHSAPYAAFVMDVRSGEVLHSRNADTQLHPASLTKMMTLYVTFEAIKNGEISLDQRIKISRKAASEPPSKLGLKAGQTIQLRYLVRAASVKSANDAATALGEAVSGSEAAFARRMNRTAKALGMSRTTFKNAHGLTESGHLSTARDMSNLGRHLFYDYPEYYNLFSRISTDAGLREVANTNRRLLGNYRGADGIKTGYTRAAGFNLVASAERKNKRIIATVFGGASSATRNAKVAELLDMGFRRAPSRARVAKSALPTYSANDKVANALPAVTNGAPGKTIRLIMTIAKSMRPVLRPSTQPIELPQAVLVAMAADIETALSEAQAPATVVAEVKVPEPSVEAPVVLAGMASTKIPILRPVSRETELAELPAAIVNDPQPEVVTRISTSGGRHWGINIGSFGSRYEAERILLKTALNELGTLDSALRKVVQGKIGYEANFVGMTEDLAAMACRRLEARSVECTTLGPS